MVLCNVVLNVLNRKETQVFDNFKILALLIIVLLWRTCLTSRFGCWAGSWNDWYIWFPFFIKLMYNGITRLRSCNCLGIGRVSSRKCCPASTAITVQALLPLSPPLTDDWQIYEGISHSVTSRCSFLVTLIRTVSGLADVADWLLQVLWLPWFAVCHEHGHLEKLVSLLTEQILFLQKLHLTSVLLSNLLCPRTGW